MLEDLMNKMERALDRLDDVRSEVGELHEEIQTIVQDEVIKIFPGIEDKRDIVYLTEYGHECESDANPFDLCVYDEGEDPCLDICLFCHQPWERK